MREKIFKNKNGITLIALIITIIVMLILVSVTITMAVNGGLFGYAREASEKTNTAKDAEQQRATLEDNMTSDELILKYTTALYSKDLLNNNGVLTQNAVHTDTTGKMAVIPEGFGIVKGCETIDNGLVISDEFDSNGNSIGNEFVWVPVPKGTFVRTWFYNNMTFKEIAAIKDGENETLRGQFFNEHKNKDSRLNYDTYALAISNNTDIENWADIVKIVKEKAMANYSEPFYYDNNNKAAEWEVTEYNNMVASVEKYGGFYIGRYEAGSTTARTSSSGVTTMVVKRDAYPYNYVAWGTNKTTPGTTGAVYLSQSMYTGKEGYGVTSTLCYGVQWDSVLRFIKDTNHNVYNSTTWGNYYNNTGDTWNITRTTAKYSEDNGETWTSAPKTKSSNSSIFLTTGARDTFGPKNIYDIAGNLYEWTMEAVSSDYRFMRGGLYLFDGDFSPAANRNYGVSPTSPRISIGFRVALYL